MYDQKMGALGQPAEIPMLKCQKQSVQNQLSCSKSGDKWRPAVEGKGPKLISLEKSENPNYHCCVKRTWFLRIFTLLYTENVRLELRRHCLGSGRRQGVSA